MRVMRRQSGLSLIELLIALAVIAIAFGALALVQVNNLRASSRSRLSTDVKAVANQVLEREMSEVLKVDETTSAGALGAADCNAERADEADSSGGTTTYRCFWFTDFYWQCPSPGSTAYQYNYQGNRSNVPSDGLRNVSCGHQNFTTSTENPNVSVSVRIAANDGPLGEGLINVSVTAKHDLGPEITLGDSITCYDVYPSPAVNTPAPCPEPGHGRP